MWAGPLVDRGGSARAGKTRPGRPGPERTWPVSFSPNEGWPGQDSSCVRRRGERKPPGLAPPGARDAPSPSPDIHSGR